MKEYCRYRHSNVSHVFGSWLQKVRLRSKNLILTGVIIVCWAIWFSRNDIIFNSERSNVSGYSFQGHTGIKFWALLQKEEDQCTISEACRVLESTTMEIFTKNGWRFNNRLWFLLCPSYLVHLKLLCFFLVIMAGYIEAKIFCIPLSKNILTSQHSIGKILDASLSASNVWICLGIGKAQLRDVSFSNKDFSQDRLK